MALRGLILDIIKLTKTHGNENSLFNGIMFWENTDVSHPPPVWFHLTIFAIVKVESCTYEEI